MIVFPPHTPLDKTQKLQFGNLLDSLNSQQIAWVSGFLAGVQGEGTQVASSALSAQRKLTVLYGTESGNSEELAEKIFKKAKQKGFKSSLTNMSETSPAKLKDAGKLLVVVSTWGDGEPPEAAVEFYNELMSGAASLEGVDFSVCALGDTSYDQFCQTGKDIDSRLEQLGGSRVVDRVDCDVDFDESFANWSSLVWSQLDDGVGPAVDDRLATSALTLIYDKKNPFPAEVLDNQLLSGEHSHDEVIHLELSLDGSGLSYVPGDVLAVVPRNAEDVVDSVIKASGLFGAAEVEVKGIGKLSFVEALTVHLDITGLSRKVVTSWQAISGSTELAQLLCADAKGEFKAWSEKRQLIDLLEEFPAKDLCAQRLVDILRKLPPRLYSIASSPKTHPGEVHLTVAAIRYNTLGKPRKGVGSCFLADEASKGSKVSVYIHQNKNFRLPDHAETPIIMVGPGTGIAPFRAFVEERVETGAAGESWLFFGGQEYNEDFFYQLEWQDQLKNGHLSRLDVAFSHDQPEKVYVQDRMAEQAADLWKWLEQGAHFYVCGDASRMAKAVNDTLLSIIASEGGKSAEEAEAYLSNLKKEKRYQRDVY